MIVAVMQPYFFPYIGYFQLMHAVDTFVFFDDVQYIDRGWVNRNRIPLGGKAAWLSMPVAHASQKLAIKDREYLIEKGAKPIQQKIRSAYPKPSQRAGLALIEDLLFFGEKNVAAYNGNLLQSIATYLGMRCHFTTSSKVLGECSLRGPERIIEVCKILNASDYINPIGGLSLYNSQMFENENIKLSFLRTTATSCTIGGEPIHFSIIDKLINIDKESIATELPNYELITAPRGAQWNA